MPIEYWVDSKHPILVTRVTGVMTDDEIVGYMRRLVDDASWRSGMDGYVDARAIEGFEVTSHGIDRAREIGIEGEARFRGSRWAVVASQPAVFGMTRMYELSRAAESFAVQVFREPEPALQWLGVEGPLLEP